MYQLEVDRGQVKTMGEEGEPKLTVTMDGVEFLRLASGNSDPMQAYFKGRIELSGDIMVAAKLAQMFKLPGGRGAKTAVRARTADHGGGDSTPVVAAAPANSPRLVSDVVHEARRRSNCAASSSGSAR